jgi:hypothetical protein
MTKTFLLAITLIFIAGCSAQNEINNGSTKNQETEMFNGKALPKHVCNVIRDGGTEAAFTGKYWDHHESGVYKCVACESVLFSSETKYDSGSGWPSFYDVLVNAAIVSGGVIAALLLSESGQGWQVPTLVSAIYLLTAIRLLRSGKFLPPGK